MRNFIDLIAGAEPSRPTTAYPFMVEYIQNGPRDLKAFVQNRIKELDWCIQEIQAAEAMITPNVQLGEDMLSQFLKYGSDYNDAARELYSLIRLAEKRYSDEHGLERHLPIADLRRNLEAYLAHGSQFFQYVMSTLRRTDDIGEHIRAVLAILPHAEAGARQYGYEDHSDKDDEYHAAMALLKGLRRLATVIQRAEGLFANTAKSLGALEKKVAASSWGSQYRPDHDEVETLYHASIHAAELAEEGFKAEKPEGRTGVGNFGTQSKISFTHDYKIAQDIVRALKEFWMITHGEVTKRTLIGWMDAEGIDWKSPEFVSTLGIGVEEPRAVGNYTFSRHRTKAVSELSSVEELAKLYNLYLWKTKLRSNPVFADLEKLVSQLKDVELKSIGMVSCQVRLDQEDEYLVGESEFRVSADRVQGIKRVL